ncbi:MAG: hypothetical protein ACE5GJ_08195 [Gemmatimonadota bacterium]
MTDRASTLLQGRKEHMEHALGRSLQPPASGGDADISPQSRSYLREEAEELYWNELEWENITDEEELEGGPLAELAFPGFLAFVRGLLLRETMPDALAPAVPRPDVVEDILRFLAGRVVELEEAAGEAGETEEARRALEMTLRLLDQTLRVYYGLSPEEFEAVSAGGPVDE